MSHQPEFDDVWKRGPGPRPRKETVEYWREKARVAEAEAARWKAKAIAEAEAYARLYAQNVMMEAELRLDDANEPDWEGGIG